MKIFFKHLLLPFLLLLTLNLQSTTIITIPAIFFKTNTSDYVDEAYYKTSFDQFTHILKDIPGLEIQVYGFRDERERKLLLPFERAKKVYMELINRGVPSTCLSIVIPAYKPKELMKDDGSKITDPEELRSKNRRVEFFVSDKWNSKSLK
jgi:outer membrane protein OmpA-like peptidoglycan-associated protein